MKHPPYRLPCLARRALLALAGLSALNACAESPVATSTVAARAAQGTRAPSTSVLPTQAYTMKQLFPNRASGARDINNKMQVVGFVKVYAFWYDLPSGTNILLPTGGADTSAANAINAFGAAGGFASRPARYPVVWPTTTTYRQLKVSGEVLDLNDRLESVGWMLNARKQQQALFWDVNTGTNVLLPLPRGATWSRANAINNDRIIVGESDVGGLLWTGAPGAFTVRVLRGIRPFGIDNGMGTVGDNGNASVPNAIYGSPDSSGFVGYGASAKRVNGYGVMAGQAYQFFNPWDAFVADRFGNVTILPVVQGLFPAGATGINDCGAVSGHVYLGSVYEAVVWDPGC